MCEGLREQPIGEPRVARQQRAVQVGPDRAADPRSLIAALSVVSEHGDDAAEWLGAGIERCAPDVVFEAGERAADTRLELAVEQDVADHPAFTGDRLEWKESDARHL